MKLQKIAIIILALFFILFPFQRNAKNTAKAVGSYKFNPMSGVSLLLSINQSPNSPVVGDQVTINWQLANMDATENLTEVEIAFTLPAGFSFVSCSMQLPAGGVMAAGDCSHAGQIANYEIDDLDAQKTAGGTLVFKIDSGSGTQNIGAEVTCRDSGQNYWQESTNHPVDIAETSATVTTTPTTLPITGADLDNQFKIDFTVILSRISFPEVVLFFKLNALR